MKNIFICIGLLFLFGCASTTGYREDKTVKSDLDFRNNTGFILLYFPVDAITSDESNLSSLGTTQDIAPKAETSLSRASQAGQAVSKLGAGLQMLEDMSTYLKTDKVPEPVATKPTAVKPPPVIANTPPSKVAVIPTDTALVPYEVSTYSDGRMRYLFRTKMVKLPEYLIVHFRGRNLFEVHRLSDRWEGDEGALLKNSHGREESVTLLLPSSLGPPPSMNDVKLIYGRKGE